MENKAQQDVENYFIPASVDTVIKLHKSSLDLLKLAKEKQSEIDNLNNFVNTTYFKGLVLETILEIEALVQEKQRILNSYTKTLTEINKQHESVK